MLSISSDLNNNRITFLTLQPSFSLPSQMTPLSLTRANIALYYFPSINFYRFVFVTNDLTNFYYYKYFCCSYRIIFYELFLFASYYTFCFNLLEISQAYNSQGINYKSHRVLPHNDDVYIYINLCRHTLNESTTSYIIIL